jgi:hypothetical protein
MHKAFEMHKTGAPVEMKQNGPVSGYPSRPLTLVLIILIFSHTLKEEIIPQHNMHYADRYTNGNS